MEDLYAPLVKKKNRLQKSYNQEILNYRSTFIKSVMEYIKVLISKYLHVIFKTCFLTRFACFLIFFIYTMGPINPRTKHVSSVFILSIFNCSHVVTSNAINAFEHSFVRVHYLLDHCNE